ncbi:MAG: hypothetical protein ACP5O8_04305, partial [Candidatus Aenigmatarchaeota archaeon]
FEKVEKYKPDIILLSVFAEDDVLPLNGSEPEELKNLVDRLHNLGTKVYFSYSVFSRSMYEEIKTKNLSFEEYGHVSDYAKYLKENDLQLYYYYFDYYIERGLIPENIAKVERKPVEGFYVEPGHYTCINPLYKPYRDFIAKVINETISIAKPDGLGFDHIRFFTFDEGYNQDIRDYILQNFGFDVYNYTPKPPFILDKSGWSKEDETYYYARAKLIEYAVNDIVSRFPGFEKYGTTMGMIEPARANGQYVELQANIFDGLLLMAYDDNPLEIARNVRETVARAKGKKVILGVSVIVDKPIENINAGLKNGADGIYLLGYKSDDSLHDYLLNLRKS